MTANTASNNPKTKRRVVNGQASLNAIVVLIRREWLKILNEPSRAIGIIVQPLLFWWVIGSGFVPSFRSAEMLSLSYQTYFYPGILALVLLFSSIFSMITLIDDKASGFMQAVLVSPCSKSSIVFGKILGALSIACFQALLFLPLMPLASIAPSEVTWLIFLMFIFLGAFCFTSLGFVMAWLSPTSSTFHALMSIILIPMWILSGAMFPLEGTWMAPIAQMNPAAWVVQGFHYSLLGHQLNLEAFQIFNIVLASGLKLIVFSAVTTSAGVYACYRNR